jgi:YD repeat-containing protein
MQRKKVNSEKIRSVGYDAASQVLEIEFTDGGVLQFSRVPSEVHRRLMAAPTIVSYFRDHIEDEYTARRLR